MQSAITPDAGMCPSCLYACVRLFRALDLPCIAHDSDNSVDATGVVIEIKHSVVLRPNQRALGGDEAVGLVVMPIRNTMERRPHCLLEHLALIDVPERNQAKRREQHGRATHTHSGLLEPPWSTRYASTYTSISTYHKESPDRSETRGSSLPRNACVFHQQAEVYASSRRRSRNKAHGQLGRRRVGAICRPLLCMQLLKECSMVPAVSLCSFGLEGLARQSTNESLDRPPDSKRSTCKKRHPSS